MPTTPPWLQVTRGNTAAALTDAREAQASNPVSVDPLWLQAAIHDRRRRPAAARRELVKATSVQPSNPEPGSGSAATT